MVLSLNKVLLGLVVVKGGSLIWADRIDYIGRVVIGGGEINRCGLHTFRFVVRDLGMRLWLWERTGWPDSFWAGVNFVSVWFAPAP